MIARIHQGKKASFRRHHLAEWLQARRMDPMDLVRALNEPENGDKYVDKKQVYRWLSGSLPHAPTQARIAAVLQLDSPEDLHRHPDDDWFAKFMRDRDAEERARIRQTMETAFPPKTGTEG